MPYTLSGSVITQTGTDTSLPTAAIAGVTLIANGDGVISSFPSMILNITGTLTIADPSKNTFICAAVRVLNGGNYTSGTFCADGVTPKTGGVHFIAVGVSDTFPRGINTGSLEVQSGGQIKLIGGSYYVSGGITYLAGATNIEEIDVSAVASRAFGGGSSRIFYGTPNISKTNCRHYDLGMDLFQKPSAGRPNTVKAFGAEYVSQYVGSPNGGSSTRYIASALSNQDGIFDFDNYGGGWVELYDCAKGAGLNVVTQAGRSNHCVPLFQNVNIRVTNLSGFVQNNVRFRLIDAPVSNSPTTLITTDGNAKVWDFRNPIEYTGVTNSSGVASFAPCLHVWHGSSNLKNLRFPSSTINLQFRGYSVATQTASLILGSDTSQQLNVGMPSVPYLTLTETQALALTGVSFTPSGATGGVITITQPRTVAEVWMAYRSWISQIANFNSNDTWTYDGSNLSLGVWTIVGIQHLTGGTITTASATAGGAIANLSIVGNVSQATPTNLSAVSITGTLIYNTASAASITLTNSQIGTVRNDGAGIITITRDTISSITNYSDPEINFLDSTLSAVGINSATIYPTLNDRDSNTNAGATFTNNLNFKYGSVLQGVTMSNTVYLRVIVGSITLSAEMPLVLGVNTLDLGVQGQLSTISAKLETMNENQDNVNNGVQKASLIIPHTAENPYPSALNNTVS